MQTIKHVEHRVLFQPGDKTVFVLAGTSIFEAAARVGLLLKTPCGGNGVCGRCLVRIAAGACPPSPACRSRLAKRDLERGMRLACQARIVEDCVIVVPEECLLEEVTRVLVAASGGDHQLMPSISKHYLEMDTPGSESECSEVERLEKALDQTLNVPLPVLRALPEVLRDCRYKGTAVLEDANCLLAFEPGDTVGRAFGVAFDLGTTTMVATLLDLTSGREVAVCTAINPQVRYGDDVISRILRVREAPGSLEQMRTALLERLNHMIAELATNGEVALDEIYEIALAGNTAMQHVFLGVSPYGLGEIPFLSVWRRGTVCRAAENGLRVHPQAALYVFPQIGGFVGGDTVAGLMAALMHTGGDSRILVDIGTNGEVALVCNGRLWAASTAAGPAFEGARIVHGMRASEGAIEKVVAANGDIECNVIGNTTPRGICGSALIDLVAELLRYGIIDVSGRMLTPEELPESVSPELRRRLLLDDVNQVRFLIVPASETGIGQDLCLYQKDVRELQLASGAMRAGFNALLKCAGLKTEELKEILLAGAFGNFIRRKNACRIGLLPHLPTRNIRFIGNAASLGARMALLSTEVRRLAEEVAARSEHVELSSSPDFQLEFADAMFFPGGID